MDKNNYRALTTQVRSHEWSTLSEEERCARWSAFPWHVRDYYLLDLLSEAQPAFWYTDSDVLMNFAVAKCLLKGEIHSPHLNENHYRRHRDAFLAASAIDDYNFNDPIVLRRYGLDTEFQCEAISIARWVQQEEVTWKNIEIFSFLASHYQEGRAIIFDKIADARLMYGASILQQGLMHTIQYFQYTVPSDKVQDYLEDLIPYDPPLMLALLEESQHWSIMKYAELLEAFFAKIKPNTDISEMDVHF